MSRTPVTLQHTIALADAVRFYGPQGTYSFMGGRDATVALAKFSLNKKFIDRSWTFAADHTDTACVERPCLLSVDELERLSSYVQTFRSKYSIIGYMET